MNPKHNGVYDFYVDISGNLYDKDDDIFIGSILINSNYISAFRDKFYREFPSLKGYAKKGTTLHIDKLKGTLTFMNKNYIKMTIVLLQRHVIKKTRKRVEQLMREAFFIPEHKQVHIKDFELKLMGLAYFKALNPHARQKYPYRAYLCIESQYTIQQAFVALKRVSYKNQFNFMPAAVYRRVEHGLKFADYVASSGRKIDKFVLDTFNQLKYIQFDPSDEELDAAFCISKYKKTPVA